jgi:hypothetical protein
MTWTLSELLPVAAHRTKRQALVDDHFGSVHEGNFTGFSAAELAAFNVVTVSTAAALISAINAVGAGQKTIIECQWNGVSSSAARIFGPKSSGLTANAGVDWGYSRPAWSVMIRPAAGYAPQVNATYGAGVFYVSGASQMHIDGMVFEACGVRFAATPTYPVYAMCALTNCRFQNITASVPAIEMNDVRTMHATDNQHINCRKGLFGAPNYFRSWNNQFKGHADGDVHGMRGYTKAAMAGWIGHIWVAGNIVYDQSSGFAGSLDHCDFLQTSLTAENGFHAGYSSLVEFNIVNLNRPTNALATQGIFGDDGGGYFGDHLNHNNIVMMNATWANMVWDSTDNKNKIVTKNMFLRSAISSTNPSTFDAVPTVRGLRTVGVVGNGTLEVSSNYAGRFTTGRVNGETFSGNVVVDPRVSAAAGTDYASVLTGNASWGSDAAGYLTYASPDAGAVDAASAKAAMIAFAKPKAGWAVNAGPSDPAFWPAGDFSALSASGGGGGGGGGGGSAPYTLAGNLVPINVAVV